MTIAAATAVTATRLWAPQVEIDHEALRKARLMEAVMFGNAPIGGPFVLTDHQARRRSLDDFQGKIVVLYFGYTFCPDVCPTDLAAIANMMDALGASGERVQPLFVTLDPERDTVEQLALFVPHFHPRLIGLTGTPEQIQSVAERYRLYFRKVEARDKSYYLLEHSAYIYLLDEHGKYAGSFPPGTPPQRLISVVQEFLQRTASAAR